MCTHGRAERGGGEDGAAIRFVEVGAHSGNVADVIADVIRNRGGVTRIVFRDSGFDFTHEVGANIGGLRVNPATDAGEEGLGRSAHAEGDHGGGHVNQFFRNRATGRNQLHAPKGKTVGHVFGGVDFIECKIPDANIEQTKADHD